jgi:hypothetical protein
MELGLSKHTPARVVFASSATQTVKNARRTFLPGANDSRELEKSRHQKQRALRLPNGQARFSSEVNSTSTNPKGATRLPRSRTERLLPLHY